MSWSCEECGQGMGEDHRLCRIAINLGDLAKSNGDHASLHRSIEDLFAMMATVIRENSLRLNKIEDGEDDPV